MNKQLKKMYFVYCVIWIGIWYIMYQMNIFTMDALTITQIIFFVVLYHLRWRIESRISKT